MDIQHIVNLLEEAGRRIIMPALENIESVQTKADGSVITEVDLACQDFLRDSLYQLDASVGFLGEEMTPEEQGSCLNNGEAYWCLDPLDGTTNFATAFPVFATSLALIENGRPSLGVIHDPARSESFYAVHGDGAWCNGQPMHASSETEFRQSVGLIDFKRLNADLAARLASGKYYRSQRNIGSCALEWAWLAAGRAQFIVHGGEKLWDFAAGSLIAAEAGCAVGDMNGEALFTHRKLVSSIAAAANQNIHKQLLELLTAS
ncbi:MAG: inositol monophosphatase family protein [Mariprofundaceae bacterium]